MPPRTVDDEFDEEEEGWDEEADDFGDEDDDGEPTFPCPYCEREIHDDAQQCPYCKNYVSREDSPPSRKPWWILAFVALCLYIVYLWIRGPRK